MTPRPDLLFHRQWWRAQRETSDPISYACALERGPSARSWRLNDAFLAALLVAVILAVIFGVM